MSLLSICNCSRPLWPKRAFPAAGALRRLAGLCMLLGFCGYQAWSQDKMQEAPRQFKQTCSLCHGSDGRGTDRAPTMVNSAHIQSLSDSDMATVIRKGKGKMP